MSAAQPIEVNSSPESGILILDEMPLSATSATRSMSRRERDSDIEVWHTPRDDSQSARSAGVGAGSVHSMESLRAVGSVTPVPTAREAEEPAAVVVDSSRPPHPNSLGLHTPPASTFAPSVASDHGEGMKSDTGIEAIPAPPATSTPAPEPEPALSNLSPLAEVEMELEAGPSQPTPTSSKRPRDETSSPSSRRRSGRVPYESRPDYARHYKYTQRRTDGGSESTGTVVKTKRQGNGKGKWKKKVKVEAETGPPIEPDDLVKVEGEGSFISKLSDKATESPAAPCWLDATEPPIEVRNSGSRGRGIYARRAFCPGDIVFSETPMLTTLPSDTEEQILDKLMRLPYHHMRAIWQLEASGGYQSLIKGLVDANSIPCADPDDPGEGAMGIFETLSRINHSCAPHAGWYWSTKQKRMLLIATHPIECGEEVTASYIDWNTLLQPRADRRAAIEEIGGFECECSVCTLHENSDASDRNRIRLAELFQSWEDVGIELLAEQSDILVRLHEAAGLSLTERLIGPLAEIYAREFYVLAAWGKMERAKAVAEREMDALTRIRGREEAHNHFFAALWKDPASWGSFGFKLA